jgi:hypothetical protein
MALEELNQQIRWHCFKIIILDKQVEEVSWQHPEGPKISLAVIEPLLEEICIKTW